ncbi:MAG: hypothetical protein H0Z28_12910 [Archaeoglobus sp.]|nr:hypothetical protein [Archaeoglobus sp.]
MKRKVALTLPILLMVAIHLTSAISATGTITGRIVSTTIDVQNISFNDLEANQNIYYYKTASGVGSVSLGNQASDMVPFAEIDFALDSGSIQIGLGSNRVLPSGAKIILDDDNTPDSTSSDPNQVQITGNSQNIAEISYAGENGDSRISYTTDGHLYVFINTGGATSGDINVDITLAS